MSEKNQEPLGKIIELGSFLIGFFIGSLWRGTVGAIKLSSKWLIVYGSLVLLTLICFAFTDGGVLMLILTILVILGAAVWVTVKEAPMKKRINYFKNLFGAVGLYEKNNLVPTFLYEVSVSPNVSIIGFNTLIPVSAWQSKKALLETHLNEKILEIRQDSHNNQIIKLELLKAPLSSIYYWNNYHMNEKTNILNIGVGYYGDVGIDLEKTPHAFIAGETGSGKSNILKCLIYQALEKNYKVTLIDFKRGVSFSTFLDYVTVHYEYKTVLPVLKNLVIETHQRLDLFREYRVDNINDYMKASGKYLPKKIVFIDELAELLNTSDKEMSKLLYDSIETLTRLSRAVGIHLIMGIQRPDSTIVSGQIKNNVSCRVCGRFVDPEPSRIVLGSDIASKLPNIKGRFILKDNDYQEFQSFYYLGDALPSKPITKDEIMPSSEKILHDLIPEVLSSEIEFDFSDHNK